MGHVHLLAGDCHLMPGVAQVVAHTGQRDLSLFREHKHLEQANRRRHYADAYAEHHPRILSGQPIPPGLVLVHQLYRGIRRIALRDDDHMQVRVKRVICPVLTAAVNDILFELVQCLSIINLAVGVDGALNRDVEAS